MPGKTSKKHKIPRSKIVFAYAMCLLGGAIAPFDSYTDYGSVEPHAFVIGLITFSMGVIVVTGVIYSMSKRGKFAQFDLDP